MPRRNSVLTTQEPVSKLEREIFETQQHLERLKADLAQAVEKHDEQIKQSLESKDSVECQMAQNVAVWWGVLSPDAA